MGNICVFLSFAEFFGGVDFNMIKAERADADSDNRKLRLINSESFQTKFEG